jgi:hypothetical protein
MIDFLGGGDEGDDRGRPPYSTRDQIVDLALLGFTSPFLLSS